MFKRSEEEVDKIKFNSYVIDNIVNQISGFNTEIILSAVNNVSKKHTSDIGVLKMCGLLGEYDPMVGKLSDPTGIKTIGDVKVIDIFKACENIEKNLQEASKINYGLFDLITTPINIKSIKALIYDAAYSSTQTDTFRKDVLEILEELFVSLEIHIDEESKRVFSTNTEINVVITNFILQGLQNKSEAKLEFDRFIRFKRAITKGFQDYYTIDELKDHMSRYEYSVQVIGGQHEEFSNCVNFFRDEFDKLGIEYEVIDDELMNVMGILIEFTLVDGVTHFNF